MRKLLLNSTAIATVAALTSGVALADVSISGSTEWSYNSRSSSVASDDGTTMAKTDGEIKFSFTNKTDSGLTIGYVVEVESDDTDSAINESSLSIAGGFGKVVLGGNDGVGDGFGVVAKDLIAEEASPLPRSTSIGTSSDIAMPNGDANKVAYYLPAMGGLTLGASFADSGTNVGKDTTSFGGRYTMNTGDVAITIGGASNTTENSAGTDTDGQNIGIKVVSGAMSISASQSNNTSANDDLENNGLAVSYKMANGMTVGAYTFQSEDKLDTSEKYVSSGVELQYVVAAGLTAVINIDDYEYTPYTVNLLGVQQSTVTVADSGTNSKFTLKASF